MVALLDDVQFLGHVGIGTIVRCDQFLGVVPAEPEGIAHAASENLRRFALIRVHAPDGRGQIHFAAIEIARVFARLIAIRAGTARDVKKTIRPLRHTRDQLPRNIFWWINYFKMYILRKAICMKQQQANNSIEKKRWGYFHYYRFKELLFRHLVIEL